MSEVESKRAAEQALRTFAAQPLKAAATVNALGHACQPSVFAVGSRPVTKASAFFCQRTVISDRKRKHSSPTLTYIRIFV